MATTYMTVLALPNSLDCDRLGIIASRAEALGRFMTGYTMLARLPAPRRRTIELRPLVERRPAVGRLLPRGGGAAVGGDRRGRGQAGAEGLTGLCARC